jgi:uncharacterized membrane protein
MEEPNITRVDTSLPHRLFEIGVVLKGLHGVLELVAAGVIYVVSGTTIYNIVTSVLRQELIEDPNDFLANLLLQHTHVSTAGKDFAALYLFVSAIANIVIMTGLLLHRKGFFPVAHVVIGAFILYQMYLFAQTHSVWLIALIVYDAAIMFLIHGEYRRRWPRASHAATV